MKNAQSLTEDGVLIAIPTFQRSDALHNILDNVIDTHGGDSNIKILVIDNNPTPIEADTVRQYNNRNSMEIAYAHVKNPGVSNARNAAIALADRRYFIFLDDDMEVTPGWAEELIRVSKAFKAGLVFGPTLAKMPEPHSPFNQHLEAYFSRTVKAKEGYIVKTLGTGGSLLDLTLCHIPSPAFDPKLNESGGEDDIFFDRLKLTGTLVAWAPQAISYELVPKSRTTLGYTLKRNFGFGQGTTRICASRGMKGIAGVLRHMLTGLAQFGVYAPIGGYKLLMRDTAYIKYFILCARAVGKILWVDQLTPKFYGLSQLVQAPDQNKDTSHHVAPRREVGHRHYSDCQVFERRKPANDTTCQQKTSPSIKATHSGLDFRDLDIAPQIIWFEEKMSV